MAQFIGPSISQLPGWRVGLIFLIFCIVSILYDHGIKALERYLRRHQKRALRHVVRRLQGEVLVLGLLSLLLAAFESYLLKICTPCSGSCSWDCPPPEAAAEAAETDGGGRRRQLLAGEGAVSELSCLQAAETCGPGSEPFWSQLALVQAHLFLFTIAVVHICYACISMLLCLWKIRRWRRFEQHAQEHELRDLHSRYIPKPGDNAFAHFLRCTVAMMKDSVNCELYCGLRRLFIERLDVDPTFDFHGFLVESMEEEFASIVGVNSVLWCIVLVWIMLPPQSYQMIWLSALAVSCVLIVAIKLQSIITCLAQEAYAVYGCRSGSAVHPGSPSRLQSMKMRLQRLSPFGGPGRKATTSDARGAIKAGSAGTTTEASTSPTEAASPDISSHSRRHPQQAQQAQLAQHSTLLSGTRRATQLGGVIAPAALFAASRSASLSDEDSNMEAVEGGADASMAYELAGRGMPPEQAGAVAAAARQAAQQQAEAEVASIVGGASRSQPSTAGAAGGNGGAAGAAAGTAAGAAGAEADPWEFLGGEGQEQEQTCSIDVRPRNRQHGQDPQQQQRMEQQQQEVERALGSGLSFDLEAQAQPVQAARAAAEAASSPHPSSSVIRRCCPWVLPRLPWHRKQQRQRISKAVVRSQSFAETYQGPDAAGLFWFGRPRLVLRIIQGIYFENSLSVAAVLFSAWQGVDFDWERYGGWPFLTVMISVEVLMLVFMSVKVLPVYALTTAAGSHSAASVIQHALRKNIKPDVARALQRMSMNAPPPGGGGEGPEGYGGGGPLDGAGARGTQPDELELQAPSEPGPADQQGEDGAAVASAQAAAAAAEAAAEVAAAYPGLLEGPPSLVRHSAPLPGVMQHLSSSWAYQAPSGGGSPSGAALAAGGGGAEAMLHPPFGSWLQQQQHSQPGSPRVSAGAGQLGGPAEFDPAALAAAAAAAAVAGPHAYEEEDGEKRSVTRLMGAMYAKKLQRELERASSAARSTQQASSIQRASSSNPRLARPGRAASGTSSTGAGSLEASRHSGPQAPALAALAEAREDRGSGQGGTGTALHDPGAAVETCPAAVGQQWLPQMLQQLRAARGNSPGSSVSPAPACSPPQGSNGRTKAAAIPAPLPATLQAGTSQPSSSSAGTANGRDAGQPGVPRKSSGFASHPTLADVRGLFAAGADTAPGGARDGQTGGAD